MMLGNFIKTIGQILDSNTLSKDISDEQIIKDLMKVYKELRKLGFGVKIFYEYMNKKMWFNL